jgi:hypothetical protein
MKTELGSTLFQQGPSETFVRQIMSTLHMDRAEATAMALSMLFRELIIAASLIIDVPEGIQGAA